MTRLKSLLLGAVFGTALAMQIPPALASTASPAASTASPAAAVQPAKVEAVPPQVETSVAPAPAPQPEAVLEQAPVIPDLGLFGKILAWVVAVNLLLGGLAAGLAKIKDITASKADDNIYDIVSKITGFLAKILDFATANTRPKSDPEKK